MGSEPDSLFDTVRFIRSIGTVPDETFLYSFGFRSSRLDIDGTIEISFDRFRRRFRYLFERQRVDSRRGLRSSASIMRCRATHARALRRSGSSRLRAPKAEFEPRLSVEAAYGTGFALLSMALVSSEFWKRIAIQRRCNKCNGSGLVTMADARMVKCPECGGMFPWYSWRRFFQSTTRVGDGGPLRQPKGQRSVLYKVEEIEKEKTDEEG